MIFCARAFCIFLLMMLPGVFSATAQDSTAVKENPVVAPKPKTAKRTSSITGIDSFPVSRRPDSIGFVDILQKFQPDSASSVYGPAVGGYLAKHPYFRAATKAVRMISLEREAPDTDWIFYLFSGLLFYLALLKLLFPKYFSDLFRVFFNTALRQKQIREQLIQEPLPSLLLNIFFVLSASVFAYFLLRYYNLIGKSDNKWLVLGFCVLGLVVIYIVKFLFIRFMGWMLGRREEADTYNFVVFMVNKFAGFILLPAGLLLAVTAEGQAKTVVFFCYLLLAILLLYRWIRSFQLVHRGLRINQLHLIIFAASFEIIPILVLYKVLFNLFG